MNMPVISIVMGLLLCAVGGAGAAHAATHAKEIWTPLIPAYFGVLFIALGAGSLAKPALRKHLMHALAMLALLGTLATGGRLATAWGKMNDVARGSHLAMTIICLATLVLCIRSFIAARRARMSEGPTLPPA